MLKHALARLLRLPSLEASRGLGFVVHVVPVEQARVKGFEEGRPRIISAAFSFLPPLVCIFYFSRMGLHYQLFLSFYFYVTK